MDQFIEDQIEQMCTSLFCQLCDVKITSLSVEQSHYSSKLHLGQVAAYRSILFKKWETEEAQVSLYSVKAKNTAITASKESLQAVRSDQYEIPKKIASPGRSVVKQCSVCNKSFNAACDFKEHLYMYPHRELSKLKSDLVKIGILIEYWTVEANGYVICSICNAVLQSSDHILSHIKSDRHIKRFGFWCKLFTTDKTDELFYCKTCDTNLNGASEAKNHYSTGVHMRHAQNISTTSSIQQKHDVKVSSANHEPPTPNLSPELTDEHHENNSMTNAEKPSSCSPELASNQVKDIATNNSILCNSKSADTKTEEPRETSKLKQDVFNELDRLVQKLYYSKTVPYTVSLEYLKRINKEVDELAKNYDDEKQKASEKGVVIKSKPNPDTPQIYNYGDFLSKSSNNINETLTKDQYNDKKVNSLGEILLNPKVGNISPKKTWLSRYFERDDFPTDEVYSDKSEELILPKICPILTNNAAQTNFETSTSKPETSLIVKRSCVSNAFPNEFQKKAANISELLDQVQQKKRDMLMDNSKEGRLERELLSEMEILMLQIEKSNIPMADILKCLEKFNKELDEQVSSNEIIGKSDGSLPDDEKSDTANAGDGKVGNENTNLPEWEMAQISEEKAHAKINEGGHEVFYAYESGFIGSKWDHTHNDDEVKPKILDSTRHRCVMQ